MMTEDTNYVVRPYISEDNAGLAVMWNESDDQWPGTFTEGVPFTEKRVREWMEKETCLMCLVAEHTTDGAIVGLGTLWETPDRKDTCYVALLNVHPAHQKRSLARRMLTQMIDWAMEHGYHRVTIETWPANLKSVPLYKKVGFYWVPDKNVFMENYIPAIRRLAVAQNFFARHDWYATFQRELKQEEDEQRHPATGEMKVFVFRWEEDGEHLEVVIDRYAQAITGLDTADFSAYAVVDESEPVQGFTYPVRWCVTNKRDEPVNVSLLAEGETEIDLHHQTSFALKGGETRTIEASFVCATDAPKLKHDKNDRSKTAPKIKTTLVIDGSMVELGTGLYYHPAVNIGIVPEFPSLLPGEPKTISINLRNRARRTLRGTVSIVPQEGLHAGWLRREFEIESEQYAGLPLKVTCDHAGSMPLFVSATITDEAQQIVTEPERLPLLVTPLGGVSADLDSAHGRILVENDFVRLVCKTRRTCNLYNKALKRGATCIEEELGVPFTPHDLARKEYALALESGQGWAKVTMTAKSGRFPGLSVRRTITVTASPVVQVAHQIVNSGTEPHQTQICASVWYSSLDREIGAAALPRTEGLFVARASEFPSAHGDMPEEPQKMAEQWIAFNREGQVAGAIWRQDVVKHEFEWGGLQLFHEKRTVAPQSIINEGAIYLYIGPGDWRDVRRTWQRMAGEPIQYIESLPEPDAPHSFDLCPSPLVALKNKVEAQLCVESVRLRKLEGCIAIEPPAGWMVNEDKVSVENVTSEEPLSMSLHLTAKDDRIGVFSGRLRLENQLRNEVRPFTILRLGTEGTAVNLEKQQQAGQQVWLLNNGRCAWTITPDFHAGIIGWHEPGEDDAEHARNHLMTSFPEAGGLGWMSPWFGGIRPILVLGAGGRGWPGRLHDETFTVEPYEETTQNGIIWRGARLTSSLQREDFQGLRTELEYLTIGGSNVLKIVFRVVNESSAPRRVLPGWITFTQVDGDHRESVLYADDLQRKRMPQETWSRVGSWGAVVNPATDRAMVMVSGCGKTLMGVMDWGKDGGHFWYDDVFTVPPSESRELVGYLALAESREEARRYEALKHIDTGQKTT